jgi:hypothetical protein
MFLKVPFSRVVCADDDFRALKFDGQVFQFRLIKTEKFVHHPQSSSEKHTKNNFSLKIATPKQWTSTTAEVLASSRKAFQALPAYLKLQASQSLIGIRITHRKFFCNSTAESSFELPICIK